MMKWFPQRLTKPPATITVGLTLVHLAVMASLGWAGIGLLFVLGVGVIVLLGVLYALFGLAWFEIEHIASLYKLPAHSLTWRPQTQPGFVAFTPRCSMTVVSTPHYRRWPGDPTFRSTWMYVSPIGTTAMQEPPSTFRSLKA